MAGGLAADTLTGGAGADRFRYAGTSQALAFANSRVNAPDRLTDFNPGEGDRIQLDFDNNPATLQRPKGMFNAGRLTGANLEAAARLAFQDKNQKQKGKQELQINEAVTFQWRNRSFIGVNDNTKTFAANRDFLVEATGTQLIGQDATAGQLSVNNYFA